MDACPDGVSISVVFIGGLKYSPFLNLDKIQHFSKGLERFEKNVLLKSLSILIYLEQLE
jgi:hypothetical protein